MSCAPGSARLVTASSAPYWAGKAPFPDIRPSPARYFLFLQAGKTHLPDPAHLNPSFPFPAGPEIEFAQLFVTTLSELKAYRDTAGLAEFANQSDRSIRSALLPTPYAATDKLRTHPHGPPARLCRHPIALHPIKHGWHLLEWWALLNERDRWFDAELELWRGTP